MTSEEGDVAAGAWRERLLVPRADPGGGVEFAVMGRTGSGSNVKS